MEVLLVDDEQDVLELTKLFLEREDGFKVETALSAEKGLELLAENDFDAVVSDYKMPKMNGLGLLKAVREEMGEDIPFILFTGKGNEEVAMEAINRDVDLYIKKGESAESNYRKISRALEKATKRRKFEREIKRTGEKAVYRSVQKPTVDENFSESKSVILKHLLCEDLNPVQLGEKLDITENAVREHLATLEEQGYVESYSKRANRGRPKKMYEITEEGRNLFPSRRKIFLKNLIRRAKEDLEEDEFRKILSKTITDLVESQSENRGTEARIENLGKFLDDFGFSFAVKKLDGYCLIQFYQCVFPEIAREVPGDPCRMLLSEAFTGLDPKRMKCRNDGDETCVLKLNCDRS